MKFYVICIFFLFATCSDLKKSDEHGYTLIESPSLSLRCGVLSVCVGMKFRNEDSNTIFVGLIHCPEMKGNDFFKTGSRYTLTFSDEKNITTCETTINKYSNQNLTTYFVKDINKK